MDCANLTNMDYSAAEAFYHGAEALKTADVALKFAGLRVSFDMKSLSLCVRDQKIINTMHIFEASMAGIVLIF